MPVYKGLLVAAIVALVIMGFLAVLLESAGGLPEPYITTPMDLVSFGFLIAFIFCICAFFSWQGDQKRGERKAFAEETPEALSEESAQVLVELAETQGAIFTLSGPDSVSINYFGTISPIFPILADALREKKQEVIGFLEERGQGASKEHTDSPSNPGDSSL